MSSLMWSSSSVGAVAEVVGVGRTLTSVNRGEAVAGVAPTFRDGFRVHWLLDLRP